MFRAQTTNLPYFKVECNNKRGSKEMENSFIYTAN